MEPPRSSPPAHDISQQLAVVPRGGAGSRAPVRERPSSRSRGPLLRVSASARGRVHACASLDATPRPGDEGSREDCSPVQACSGRAARERDSGSRQPEDERKQERERRPGGVECRLGCSGGLEEQTGFGILGCIGLMGHAGLVFRIYYKRDENGISWLNTGFRKNGRKNALPFSIPLPFHSVPFSVPFPFIP